MRIASLSSGADRCTCEYLTRNGQQSKLNEEEFGIAGARGEGDSARLIAQCPRKHDI